MYRSILAVMTAAALFPSVALATVPSGKYAGYYGTHTSSKVSFTVKNGFVHNFNAFVPALCLGGNYEFVTFDVPKAKINGNKVDTYYTFRNSSGLTIGHAHLTATFSGSHAKGTLGGSYTGCTIATYPWNAHQ